MISEKMAELYTDYLRTLPSWSSREFRSRMCTPFRPQREIAPDEWDEKMQFWTTTIQNMMELCFSFSTTINTLAAAFGCQETVLTTVITELHRRGVVQTTQEVQNKHGLFYFIRRMLRRGVDYTGNTTPWFFARLFDQVHARLIIALRAQVVPTGPVVLTAQEMLSYTKPVHLDRWIQNEANSDAFALYRKQIIPMVLEGRVEGWKIF